jgi:2-dehydro-3-deoxygluconokinase
MNTHLKIKAEGALDFISLGALVHQIDPGIIRFRKATECHIHVCGGVFNVAANLADCFGLQAGIVTSMVDYPISELVADRML